MCICGSITRRTSTKHVSSDRLHCFALKRSFVCTLSNGMLYFFSTDGDMRVILCRRNASQLLKLLGKKPEGGGKKKKKERTHNHHLHIQDIVNVKREFRSRFGRRLHPEMFTVLPFPPIHTSSRLQSSS